MTDRKSTAAESADKKTKDNAKKYSKENLLASIKFNGKKDALSVLLKDGEKYTQEQAEKLYKDYMKGKVQ